jgi:hypothetical protein
MDGGGGDGGFGGSGGEGGGPARHERQILKTRLTFYLG